jgi:hypothetical protein
VHRASQADVSRSLGIDAEYYIRNLLIPPLSRIFNLVGADVENWFDSMPRIKRAGRYDPSGQSGRNGTGKMRVDSHFKSSHCVVCGAESSAGELRACSLATKLTGIQVFVNSASRPQRPPPTPFYRVNISLKRSSQPFIRSAHRAAAPR